MAYTIEYGADTTEQSALNMLYLLGYSARGTSRIFGKSNEKYHVRGGNDQVAQGVCRPHGSSAGAVLPRVRAEAEDNARHSARTRWRSAGRLRNTPFVTARSPRPAKAVLDPAVLGRHRQGRASGLQKTWAIRELGMGTNSKLHLQFKQRFWNDLGSQRRDVLRPRLPEHLGGLARARPARRGILVDYTGGTIGASFGSGTPTARGQTLPRSD